MTHSTFHGSYDAVGRLVTVRGANETLPRDLRDLSDLMKQENKRANLSLP